MDVKLKKKWIKALRSGKYRRGSGRLKDGHCFCCLGVLADIQGAKWTKNAYGENTAEIPKIRPGYDIGMLEPREAGGLRTSVMQNLADMNDNGTSFEEIADYIERRL